MREQAGGDGGAMRKQAIDCAVEAGAMAANSKPCFECRIGLEYGRRDVAGGKQFEEPILVIARPRTRIGAWVLHEPVVFAEQLSALVNQKFAPFGSRPGPCPARDELAIEQWPGEVRQAPVAALKLTPRLRIKTVPGLDDGSFAPPAFLEHSFVNARSRLAPALDQQRIGTFLCLSLYLAASLAASFAQYAGKSLDLAADNAVEAFHGDIPRTRSTASAGSGGIWRMAASGITRTSGDAALTVRSR